MMLLALSMHPLDSSHGLLWSVIAIGYGILVGIAVRPLSRGRVYLPHNNIRVAAGALIGASIAAPYYGGVYDCTYSYGYGDGCGDYGYGYAPAVGYGYGVPDGGYGYGHYAYRHYVHRHYGYRVGYGGYGHRIAYARCQWVSHPSGGH